MAEPQQPIASVEARQRGKNTTPAKPDAAAVRAAIDESRAWFETSVARLGTSLQADVQILIERTRELFCALDVDAQSATTVAARQAIIDRAKELARMRAYVIPKQELLIEAHEAIADLRTWAVPAKVISSLTSEILPLIDDDEALARGATRSLFETYDYWDSYVAIYARTMRAYAIAMLLVLLAALTGGVFLLHFTHIYSGIFCAGVAGGLLSIISKMPPVLGVGETNAYQLRIFSRLGIGVAASLIGMGLLAADIITIKVRQTTIADVLDGTVDRPGSVEPATILVEPGHGSGSNSAAQNAPASGAVAESTADGGVSPIDAGTVDGGVAPSPTPVTESWTAAAGSSDHLAVSGKSTRKHLPQGTVLILMAIAMLFAFSERALATFESAVLPSRTVTTKKKSTGDGAPSSKGVTAGQAQQGAAPVAAVSAAPLAPAVTTSIVTTTTTDT